MFYFALYGGGGCVVSENAYEEYKGRGIKCKMCMYV